MHHRLKTVIVAPMTKGNRPADFRCPLAFRDENVLVLLDQIRSVDKSRLIKLWGSLTDAQMGMILRALRDVFVE